MSCCVVTIPSAMVWWCQGVGPASRSKVRGRYSTKVRRSAAIARKTKAQMMMIGIEPLLEVVPVDVQEVGGGRGVSMDDGVGVMA